MLAKRYAVLRVETIYTDNTKKQIQHARFICIEVYGVKNENETNKKYKSNRKKTPKWKTTKKRKP